MRGLTVLNVLDQCRWRLAPAHGAEEDHDSPSTRRDGRGGSGKRAGTRRYPGHVARHGFLSRPAFEDLEAMAGGAFDRVAMITPVHSHFDHAMDVGAVAKATGATVVSSESTAHIARGAGVDEARIVVVDDRHRRPFGKFNVEPIRSAHAPLMNGGPPIPGSIDAPLKPPACIGDWKRGRKLHHRRRSPRWYGVDARQCGLRRGRLGRHGRRRGLARHRRLGITGQGSRGRVLQRDRRLNPRPMRGANPLGRLLDAVRRNRWRGCRAR